MIERAAHKPSIDLSTLSENELAELRAKHLEEIKQLENPSIFQKVAGFASRLFVASSTLVAGLFIAEKTFISNSRNKFAKEAERKLTNSNKTRTEYDYLTILPEVPDKPQADIVWSCAGCSGCTGGMYGQCGAVKIDDNAPNKANYHPVTEDQIATLKAKGDYAQKAKKYYAEHPNDPKLQIRGMEDLTGVKYQGTKTATPSEEKTDEKARNHSIEKQWIFASVTSSIFSLITLKWVDDIFAKPTKDHIHHLKHEVQHIEDEMNFRERIKNQKTTQSESIR